MKASSIGFGNDGQLKVPSFLNDKNKEMVHKKIPYHHESERPESSKSPVMMKSHASSETHLSYSYGGMKKSKI